MLFVIDNYDSFTYNLVQYLGELGQRLQVARNDQVSVADIAASGADALIISPGPCTPAQAGISVEAARHFSGRMPILGVCLGLQSIAVAHGGAITTAEPMHGKISQIHHSDSGLFADLPNPMTATRYHSLVVHPERQPADFILDAWTESAGAQEHIMGMRHSQLPIWGVQFHPESIMTTEGKSLLGNFLRLADLLPATDPAQ